MSKKLFLGGLFLMNVVSIQVCAQSPQTLNCTCTDQGGENTVTITGYTGTSCSELVGNGDSSVTLTVPIEGTTLCSASENNLPCLYTLQRIHIASCTTASQ